MVGRRAAADVARMLSVEAVARRIQQRLDLISPLPLGEGQGVRAATRRSVEGHEPKAAARDAKDDQGASVCANEQLPLADTQCVAADEHDVPCCAPPMAAAPVAAQTDSGTVVWQAESQSTTEAA